MSFPIVAGILPCNFEPKNGRSLLKNKQGNTEITIASDLVIPRVQLCQLGKITNAIRKGSLHVSSSAIRSSRYSQCVSTIFGIQVYLSDMCVGLITENTKPQKLHKCQTKELSGKLENHLVTIDFRMDLHSSNSLQ